MNLNSELKDIFKEYQIDDAYGILCLLSVYHNIKLHDDLERILQPTLMQINVAKIIEKYYKTDEITWNYSLYESEEIDKEWGWVNTEYRLLFKTVSPVKAGSASGCVKKMKDFFRKHPAVRKQDVIEATKLYIQTVDDPTYLQQADYFIIKNSDVKSSFSSRLEQFLELINDKKSPADRVNYKMMK